MLVGVPGAGLAPACAKTVGPSQALPLSLSLLPPYTSAGGVLQAGGGQAGSRRGEAGPGCAGRVVCVQPGGAACPSQRRMQLAPPTPAACCAGPLPNHRPAMSACPAGLLIFADWYHLESVKKLRFFDDNTRSWWEAATGAAASWGVHKTRGAWLLERAGRRMWRLGVHHSMSRSLRAGGANVPALNDLLTPFGAAFEQGEGRYRHPRWDWLVWMAGLLERKPCRKLLPSSPRSRDRLPRLPSLNFLSSPTLLPCPTRRRAGGGGGHRGGAGLLPHVLGRAAQGAARGRVGAHRQGEAPGG